MVKSFVIIQCMGTAVNTVEEILHHGVDLFDYAEIFYGHGTDNAWDEALQLVLHVLHLSYDSDPAILQQSLTAEQRQAILSLYERRIRERTPAAYLIQQAYFAGLPFYVDERVLIPRSPIAELIEQIDPLIPNPPQ